MIVPVDTNKGRYYPWDNDKYVSVTTAISEGVPKPGLNMWKIKNVAELAARNRKKLATITRIPDAKEFILNLFFKKQDNTAANLGSHVHSVCERIAKGEDTGDIQEAAVPYVNSFRQFIEDYSPEFVETEATVFSRTHGYAGTADAFIIIDGKLYVVDYKTGKSVWPEVALQLAAYRHGDFFGRSDGTEDPIPKVDGALVLHIRPEGYTAIPVDAGADTFDTFLSALDIFRWQRIDGKHAMGEAWE